MKTRTIISVSVGLIVAALVVLWCRDHFSPGPQRAHNSSDLDPDVRKLQGKWEFVSMEVEGSKKPAEDIEKYRIVLEGDQWTVFVGSDVVAQTTFELDPDRNPKRIDLVTASDTDAGRLIQGIYMLKGDEFTMCDRGAEKGERPTEFATRPHSGLVLVVLKRVKP